MESRDEMKVRKLESDDENNSTGNYSFSKP